MKCSWCDKPLTAATVHYRGFSDQAPQAVAPMCETCADSWDFSEAVDGHSHVGQWHD